MGYGVPELLILVLIVVVLFGVGRISRISGELGRSIRTLRESLRGEGASED